MAAHLLEVGGSPCVCCLSHRHKVLDPLLVGGLKLPAHCLDVDGLLTAQNFTPGGVMSVRQ
jgi:hypothetical protein